MSTPAAPDADAQKPQPFAAFAPPLAPLGDAARALRRRITAATRRPEPEAVAELVAAAQIPAGTMARVTALATRLVERLRARPGGGAVEGLIHEYDLSSDEGVALMCLAEALLRIPDRATRDALIRDKIARGDWRAHVGASPSPFVNAATWGLVVTGKLVGTASEASLSDALVRLVARCGEPVIRKGVDLAMRLMGEQFVSGQTIEEALRKSRAMEARGFCYSYDMLGEAAMTAEAAAGHYAEYERAIHAIGKVSAGRGVYAGPGLSIKLSALHPRFARAQGARVMGELLARVTALARLAKGYDIGFNIDAEEADRVDISLDLLEALALDPALAGWNGIGFVVQAYGKRGPMLIDCIIDLARRSGHRMMLRLVKGAYWDAEIKRAQIDGQPDFPVFTRKVHTDVCYAACARKALAARDLLFPQFATHNAETLATVFELAGPVFKPGDYEFQCLHGMGEPLYEAVVGPQGLNRPCRIYAPVGTYATLLSYLVRRLLENGSNSSFVNRIADPAVPLAELVADPVALASGIVPFGSPHPKITAPPALYGAARRNSAGFDLADEARLEELSKALTASVHIDWTAAPMLGQDVAIGPARPVRNPADHRDVVGHVAVADAASVEAAFAYASAAAGTWAATAPSARAALLAHASDIMEARLPTLLGLIIREGGKSAANAVAEVREAVDFLRYYGARVAGSFAADTHPPLGPVVCISPWNFPLAIFTGQVAAALAAGNPVLAKPASATPLIAAEAVRILHEAGVPRAVVQLLPGPADIGAMLVGHADARGVMLTGSTEVARLIQRQLAERLSPDGQPIPLIAETGGQNAMIVDSSALAEQVVADVLTSAFDSAGQRCSALRVLCLQDDVADRMLAMLKGAMRELCIGNPDRLATDVGPVITAAAADDIRRHIEAMARDGHNVMSLPLPPDAAHGSFVAPTLIEIGSIAELSREVFGPVLHVLRYQRRHLDRLIDAINATGYGLTFGLHTRIDETIAAVTRRIEAGNIYVNRNIIGAVVGVQPFGGRGLSGTGPKAGGPLYLARLVRHRPAAAPSQRAVPDAAAVALAAWLEAHAKSAEAGACRAGLAASRLGETVELRGPVGERNLYDLRPRGRVLVVPDTEFGFFAQLGAVLAAGDTAVVEASDLVRPLLAGLPPEVASRVETVASTGEPGPIAAVLVEGERDRVLAVCRAVAQREGPIVAVQAATTGELRSGARCYCVDWLMQEISTSINTAAAGGNASLMTIG
jgi:RHH-type proline utilization regulon transcriptional repressor/proline dehydrogenase/delta 1-pyrroline-5-carboxylate dehydrogenase